MPRPRGKPQDGELSPERLAFCEGLLEGKNARQAYEESGFKARGRNAKSNARQLLKEPEIQFYLAARRMELRERVGVTDERVLSEMMTIAFFDVGEVASEELNGPEDIQRLPEHVRRVITGWRWDKHGHFVIEFADKARALDQLARYLGLYQQDRRNDSELRPNLLTTAFWRYVISLHISQGMSLAEAISYGRNNPGIVEKWGRAAGLLPPADER